MYGADNGVSVPEAHKVKGVALPHVRDLVEKLTVLHLFEGGALVGEWFITIELYLKGPVLMCMDGTHSLRDPRVEVSFYSFLLFRKGVDIGWGRNLYPL